MELNLWNTNHLLQEWLEKHAKNVLKCDFDFDVVNPSSNELIDTISEKFGIERDYIALSAGISELIFSIFSAPLWENVYIFHPEFGLYAKCIQHSMYKEKVTIMNLESVHMIDHLIEIHQTTPNDLLCISSPNWFFGEKITYEEVEKLLGVFLGTVVIDEAYINYAEEPDTLIQLAETQERIILLRSFSKGWFVSGLRIGFMVSKGYAAKFRDEIIIPHSVSTPSMRVIRDLLNDPFLMKCFRATRNDVVNTREYLKTELDNMEGCTYYQSESNFLTILLDDRFEGRKEELSEAFGAKIMEIRMNGKLNLKYWISDKENAEEFVRMLKKIPKG